MPHRRGSWLGEEPLHPGGRLVLAILIALALVGVTLIALPDSNDRVFALSPEHGPAPLDLVGSVLVTAAWAGLVARPIAVRQQVARRMGTAARSSTLFSAGLGLGLLVASIFSQVSWWWIVGVAILVGIQAYVVAVSLRASNPRSSG